LFIKARCNKARSATMDSDSITWTGTPDDQRAEWRGMKAYAVWCGPQEWEATVYRGSVKGERLLATLPGRPLPRSVQEAKWLCELVMRHEAAKAELEQLRDLYTRAMEYRDYVRGGKQDRGGVLSEGLLFAAVDRIARKDGE
jgi:hypothetical protein